MKNSKKILLGILFTGLTLSLSSNANAIDWLDFGKVRNLTNPTDQHYLQERFAQTYTEVLQSLVESVREFKVSQLASSLNSWLINKVQKKFDFNTLLSIDLSIEQIKKVGLVNYAIAKAIAPKIGQWTTEQIDEAFEILWNGITSPLDVAAIRLSISTIDSKLQAKVICFLESAGDTLCEKTASLLAGMLIDIAEPSGCLSCFKSCLTITTHAASAAKDIAEIVKMFK